VCAFYELKGRVLHFFNKENKFASLQLKKPIFLKNLKNRFTVIENILEFGYLTKVILLE
jgi:hypothetical protein